MTAKEQLIQEIKYSPEPLIQEVLDFLLFTKNRYSLQTKTIDTQENHQPTEDTQEFRQDVKPDDLDSLSPNNARDQDHYLNRDFWESEPLSSQPIPAITDIRILAASFWEDEPIDEFDQFIASSRQADNV